MAESQVTNKQADATGRFREFEQANLVVPASSNTAEENPKPKSNKSPKKKKEAKQAPGTVVSGVYITNTGKRVNIDSLRQQYPTFSWVFDVDERFKDTRDLTVQFLAGDITEERYAALLPQSSWYRNEDNVRTTQRIKTRYGDIGLPPTALSTLVSQTISFNYDDAQLDQAFYGEVFKRDPITGAYINEAARNTVLKSQPAAEIRNNARAMFTTAGDNDIENILTGKTTYEDFDRSIRNTAKAVYGNWAPMLDDPAMTMEKIVRPWQEMAGSVLEMDPSQIDMTRPEFQAAYNTTDASGNPKALSLGDWYVKLRSDPTYKWEKTTQAKSEARDLAFNLAKVFGKIV